MIQLTAPDGARVEIDRGCIREVHPLGDGAIVFLKTEPPVRVMQSVERVVALWKR